MLHNCIVPSTLSLYFCVCVRQAFKGKYLHENDSWKTFKHRSVKKLTSQILSSESILFLVYMSHVTRFLRKTIESSGMTQNEYFYT